MKEEGEKKAEDFDRFDSINDVAEVCVRARFNYHLHIEGERAHTHTPGECIQGLIIGMTSEQRGVQSCMTLGGEYTGSLPVYDPEKGN